MVKYLDKQEIQRVSKLTISEKIERGDWYQYPKEPSLQRIVKQSAQTIQRLNAEALENYEAANQQLHDFLVHLDATAEIYFPIQSIEYPEYFTVGADSFINSQLLVLSAGRVTIGKHCFIGPNCQLFTPNHSTDKLLRREGWQYDEPISIGDDSWIGGSVIILPGVSIGNNVVIGAGSVVTKDIPDDTIAAGNPARVIRRAESEQLTH